MKIYLAGPLFTDAEVRQRKEEAIKVTLELGLAKGKLYAPINFPFNGEDPSSVEIFRNDTAAIEDSNAMFADLSNNDPGTMVEIGYAIAKGIPVYGYYNDIRFGRTADSTKPFEINIGFNQYLVGALIESTGKIFKDIDEVLTQFTAVNQNGAG